MPIKIFIISLSISLLASMTQGGKLDSLEKEASKPKQPSPHFLLVKISLIKHSVLKPAHWPLNQHQLE